MDCICKNCMFWTRAPSFRKNLHVGCCLHTSIRETNPFDEGFLVEAQDKKIFYWAADPTDADVDLCTTANFGCVNFEHKGE